MTFLHDLLFTSSVAHSVLILSLVIALGLVMGSIKAFGVSLGVAGVLFAGLFFGHFGLGIDHEVLEFVREFGLILFVYTIGMQVGPGFLSSLKRNGLQLNFLAASIVGLGALIAAGLYLFAGIPLPAVVGMFSGATTNTPSLAVAQQALKEFPGITEEISKMPGLGYAVSYPLGIMGIILTMILSRVIFKINPAKESQEHTQLTENNVRLIDTISLKVENPNLNGVAVKNIPTLQESHLVISRVMHENRIQIAMADTKIFQNDIIQVVGTVDRLEQFRVIVGSKSDVDLRAIKSGVMAKRVVITKSDVVGASIGELEILNRYGVTVTRVSRSEIEFAASADIRLQYADTLLVVGEENDIRKFATDVGNAPKQLDHPFIIPVFVGIALGVILGNIPFHLPGIPAPVKLGLAGGPLIVAIILSRVNRIGNLIWYMPMSANFMLRELGITLFLACVGLKSGDQFVKTLVEGSGFYWMVCATLITFIPLMAVAFYARIKYKLNYMTLCGLLAGSMTDPPALAFANSIAASNAPSVAYATVYPLVMILRIISAQVLVLFFMK